MAYLELDQVKEILDRAIDTLSTEDRILLDFKTNERAITHKLAEYLQIEFSKVEGRDYKVDCEYNRWSDIVKLNPITVKNSMTDDREGETVYPDIIVHIRDSQDDNLLVIEVKKSNNKDIDDDIKKLKAFTKEKSLKYNYGLFLSLGVKDNIGENVKRWFIDGEEL